jgi:hypothetical protein
MLRTRVDRVNNREYILWVEKSETADRGRRTAVRKMAPHKPTYLRDTRLKKRTREIKEPPSIEENMTNSMIADLMNVTPPEGGFTPTTRKVCFGSNSSQQQYQYTLKIYDYTKKLLICETSMRLNNERIADLFVFWNDPKVVGYILMDEEHSHRYIHYKRLGKNKKKTDGDKFNSIELASKAEDLLFSEEESCYFFRDRNACFKLTAFEGTEDNKVMEMYKANNGGEKCDGVLVRPIKMLIKKQGEFDGEVLSLAFNDQYLAVLT